MGLPPPAAFNPDPVLVAAVCLTGALGGGLLAARRHAERLRGRWLALAAALLLLVGVWLSPLGTDAQHYLLTAHLLQITILMGAVPPLLLVALPRQSPVQPPSAVRAILRAVTHPVFAILAVNAAFFGWHTTAAYGAAMQSGWLYGLEQLTLLLTSICFWWPIVSPFSPPLRPMSPLLKMGYILLATIPQTFGGLVVALAHHLLFPVYAAAPRLLGLDPLTDQQIAGASIALVSKIALFAAFIVIFMHALGSESAESDDGGGDGGIRPVIEPQPLPSGTPRWLIDVARDRTVAEPPARRPRVRVPAGSGSDRG